MSKKPRWQLTDVIFRVFPEGDVIALFPAQAYDSKPHRCMSYQKLGQHGGADVDLISKLRPATPQEYAPLKAELESQGYHLRVKLRSHRGHYRARIKEID